MKVALPRTVSKRAESYGNGEKNEWESGSEKKMNGWLESAGYQMRVQRNCGVHAFVAWIEQSEDLLMEWTTVWMYKIWHAFWRKTVKEWTLTQTSTQGVAIRLRDARIQRRGWSIEPLLRCIIWDVSDVFPCVCGTIQCRRMCFAVPSALLQWLHVGSVVRAVLRLHAWQCGLQRLGGGVKPAIMKTLHGVFELKQCTRVWFPGVLSDSLVLSSEYYLCMGAWDTNFVVFLVKKKLITYIADVFLLRCWMTVTATWKRFIACTRVRVDHLHFAPLVSAVVP